MFLDVEFFTCPTLQAWGHQTYNNYNKRRDPIFDGARLVPLPPAVSLLPSASKEGVVLSEFHRYRGISSCLREWIDTAAGLIYTMHRLDYSWDTILHYVRMYVEANTPLFPGTSRIPDSHIVDMLLARTSEHVRDGLDILDRRNQRLSIHCPCYNPHPPPCFTTHPPPLRPVLDDPSLIPSSLRF